jgi:hypothetical protein
MVAWYVLCWWLAGTFGIGLPWSRAKGTRGGIKHGSGRRTGRTFMSSGSYPGGLSMSSGLYRGGLSMSTRNLLRKYLIGSRSRDLASARRLFCISWSNSLCCNCAFRLVIADVVLPTNVDRNFSAWLSLPHSSRRWRNDSRRLSSAGYRVPLSRL